MPFRLDPERYGEFRAKMQFTTAAWMPAKVYEACLETGTVSGTVYLQRAVCEALARDLGLDLEELLADLPRNRGPAAHLYDPAESRHRRPVTDDQSGGVALIGPANTNEEVR